ncbi:hypothetical protein C2G38_1243672 [Gigaspora rosea]|uniref:Transmembrane protein n=1 Tax=Gigaspora rosea TaxID=44941 RepID=A0A397VEJ4_9GLOM|nr:hypothetical protein C2G38_1243672 [Gigaspora rosea]
MNLLAGGKNKLYLFFKIIDLKNMHLTNILKNASVKLLALCKYKLITFIFKIIFVILNIQYIQQIFLQMLSNFIIFIFKIIIDFNYLSNKYFENALSN